MKQLNIQWQIGNQCNFRCDYCHHDYHDGSNPFLDYELFDSAFRNIRESVTEHDQVIIEFLGGEPCISRAARETIVDAIDPRFKFNITSNGSADLDWWEKASPNLNIINLAWHYKADDNHYKSVLEVLSRTKDRFHLIPIINALPDSEHWDHAVALHEELKSKGYNSQFKILFVNHNKGNDKFMDYKPRQVEFYTKNSFKKLPVTTSIKDVEASLYTEYKSHLCWAGVDQVVINYFGYVYRGWCMVGQSYGNIFDSPVKLDATPRVCTRVLCKNAFDQEAKKSDKSWGIV